MIASEAAGVNEPFPFALPPLRVVVRRVLTMMALWMGFGMVVGSSVLPGNLIGIISGAIAGAIVLPWMGMILGLMGGPVKDSFFGGVSGSLVAMLYSAIWSGSIDTYMLNLCLIMGGAIGANFTILLAIRRRWAAIGTGLSRY